MSLSFRRPWLATDAEARPIRVYCYVCDVEHKCRSMRQVAKARQTHEFCGLDGHTVPRRDLVNLAPMLQAWAPPPPLEDPQ